MPKSSHLFLLLALSAPAFAQYAGPAVLARGEAPGGSSSPQVDFRPFVELNATYSTGLAGVGLSNTGSIANDSSYGLGAAWGLSGLHRWHHSSVGLYYSGNIAHNVRKTFYDTLGQTLLLGITHDFSPHISMSSDTSAGIFSRNYGQMGLPQSIQFDPSSTYIPTTDYFDNRTLYMSSTAGLVWHESARLSFQMGGSALLVRRRSAALYGDTGYGSSGDVQYRLTRRTTVGGVYAYQHFSHAEVEGGTDVHMFMGSYSVALSRRTEVSVMGGIARVEFKEVGTTPIDPVIAALLGVTSASQIYHGLHWTPDGSVRLSHTLRQGVATLDASRGVIPGNGLFLTSYSNRVWAGYTFTGLRRWSFNALVGYSDSNVLGRYSGHYGGTYGQFSMSRRLAGVMHLVVSYNVQHYGSNTETNYNRTVQSATTGLGFTPGDIPLRVW